MTINIPRRWRIVLYVVTLVGAPVVVYLRAKGYIGDLELALWGAEVTAVNTLALLNVSSSGAIKVQIDGNEVTRAINKTEALKGRKPQR